MSISNSLVALIRNKKWSEAEMQQAAILLLDALATAYAGAATEVGKKLIEWANKEPLNNRSKVFLMAALTHITETDDLHRASVTHPGCIVVPCVLALSQRHGVADRKALLAVLHGFESMCRIGNAVGPAHYSIWHNTATCGPFGSAFAAAELLDLSDTQTMYALGNAGTQSSGLWEFMHSGAMSKHLHAGRASEAGLLAAELAQLNFTGPPHILEGAKGFFAGLCPDPDPEQVLRDADGPWQLSLTSVKPWPSCRHTHPSIHAALEVQSKLGNRAIQSVTVNTYDAAIEICDRVDPTNDYQAKFSLQHCIAKALMDGTVDLVSFDQQARNDAGDLRKRIKVQSADPYKSSFPAAWGASVSVTTVDGELIKAIREHCKGDPELALDKNELLEKATMLLRYAGFSTADSLVVCEQVLAMPESEQPCTLMQEFLDTML